MINFILILILFNFYEKYTLCTSFSICVFLLWFVYPYLFSIFFWWFFCSILRHLEIFVLGARQQGRFTSKQLLRQKLFGACSQVLTPKWRPKWRGSWKAWDTFLRCLVCTMHKIFIHINFPGAYSVSPGYILGIKHKLISHYPIIWFSACILTW